MKKVHIIGIAIFIMVLGFSVCSSKAIERIPQESGFTGFIRPGVGYLNYKSNMVASFLGYDLSDKSINSLSSSPDSQSNALVMAPFSLQYTFAETRTQLFLGTDLTDLIRMDFSQQIGVRQEIGKAGVIQGGFLFSGIPIKVWKDPYVVNLNREETSQSSNGGRLVWDRIFGSQLQLQYTYRKIDVSSERSGEFLDLPAFERKLLERDGNRHVGEILYAFNIAEKHRLAPSFSFGREDRDGDAMTNDTYDFQITYAYFGDTFSFTGNASIGWSDYDERNPIYHKTRNDDRYGINGVIYYKNPWGWKLFGSAPMNFYINAAFVKSDANIDFYDQEVFLTSAGVFFKW
jgi:hypothetical protein